MTPAPHGAQARGVLSAAGASRRPASASPNAERRTLMVHSHRALCPFTSITSPDPHKTPAPIPIFQLRKLRPRERE